MNRETTVCQLNGHFTIMINITKDGKITKEILQEGSGPQPVEGQKVKVHYEATVKETGKMFDSTRNRDQAYKFIVGESPLKAWSIGVASMKVGEKSRFEVAPEYAYGEKGLEPDVLPNSTLIIEAELLKIMEVFEGASQAIERASHLNDEAATKFRAQEYKEAIKIYSHANSVLEDYFGDDVISWKVKINRNLSLMYSKIEDWTNCLKYATNVLATEKDDVKALIRKLEAELGLGNVVEARKTYERIARVSKEKALINSLKTKVESAEKIERQRENQEFAKMFNK